MRPETVTAGPTGVTEPAREFEVDTVDRIGAVDPAEWDAAVQAHRLPVFYSRAFLAAYERHPLTAIDGFCYLVVRRRGAAPSGTPRTPGPLGEPPVAVVPAYLQNRPDPLGCLTAAYPESAGQPALLSHVWHCYDAHVGGPTTSPALAAAVVSALRRRARELGAPWCGLVNVRDGGPTATTLAGAGLPTRYLVDRFTADLDGQTDLDDFLERRVRPRHRRNLRRYRRRAAEHGVTCAVVPIEEADLAEAAALCRGSASRHGSEEYYPPDRFERFLAEMGPIARVVEIRQRGRLVSAGVCLLDAERLHCWAGGADYRVDGNFSPYYLMFTDSLDQALRLRRPVFEGGRGNGEFKLRYGLTARPLVGCLVRS